MNSFDQDEQAENQSWMLAARDDRALDGHLSPIELCSESPTFLLDSKLEI